jgi:hypothetical protein
MTRRCNGKMRNGPDKRYTRCTRCGQVDWEANEGDLCTREVEAVEGEERPRTIRPPRKKPR